MKSIFTNLYVRHRKWKIVKITCLVVLLYFFINTVSKFQVFNLCGFNPYQPGTCFNSNRTHNYQYLILEPEICIVSKSEVFLLILVISVPNEFQQRQTIRNTWGSVASSDSAVRLAFMLGFSPVADKTKLQEESELYHDIIQKDFDDSYRNLSIKSEAILKFASTYCKNAKYILKADSDMFMNIPYLLQVLRNSGNDQPWIMGFVFEGAFPIESKQSKWYTSKQSFPLWLYPDYTSGTAYVISGQLTGYLFDAALRTRLFWLEDIFITGICRERIGAMLIHNNQFSYERLPVDICSFNNMISGHNYNMNEITEIWNQKENNKSCR